MPASPNPLRPESVVGHLDRLHRAARALCGGSRHEAEDLVQDTCVQLLGADRELHGADELPYLLTALRHTHVDRRRAAARRPRPVELAEGFELADRCAGVVEQVSAREVMRWVRALPAEPRAAVLAVDVAGLSRADASRVLGVGERRVAASLARGRASLAVRLAGKDQGASRTPSPRAAGSIGGR